MPRARTLPPGPSWSGTSFAPGPEPAGAIFDPAGAYRYLLWRRWDAALPVLGFILLNPSTAGGGRDDPTIRRCCGFARAWGFGAVEVANLYAFRAARPRDLFAAPDPAGPANDAAIAAIARRVDVLAAAWGNAGGARPRADTVLAAIGARPLEHLGLTKRGHPRHVLYLPRTTRLESWLSGPASRPVS